MFPDVFRAMAAADRPASYWRCLMLALHQLRPDEHRRWTRRHVELGTGLSQAMVQSAMVQLRKDGIILRDPADRSSYRISRRVVWVGTPQDLLDAVERDGPDPAIDFAANPTPKRGRARQPVAERVMRSKLGPLFDAAVEAGVPVLQDDKPRDAEAVMRELDARKVPWRERIAEQARAAASSSEAGEEGAIRGG